MADRRLILASASPRRRTLLKAAGYIFEVLPPDAGVETRPQPNESIESAVLRLARDKAWNVAQRVAEGIVLGADTLVECAGELVGKPKSRDDARRILTHLSGCTHRVVTGIALYDGATRAHAEGYDETVLSMQPLSATELERYLDSQRWEGKAGAFGYQDGNDWVTIERGSESNVVGLPLELLARMLAQWPDVTRRTGQGPVGPAG